MNIQTSINVKDHILHIVQSWHQGETLEYMWKDVPHNDIRHNQWYTYRSQEQSSISYNSSGESKVVSNFNT